MYKYQDIAPIEGDTGDTRGGEDDSRDISVPSFSGRPRGRNPAEIHHDTVALARKLSLRGLSMRHRNHWELGRNHGGTGRQKSGRQKSFGRLLGLGYYGYYHRGLLSADYESFLPSRCRAGSRDRESS